MTNRIAKKVVRFLCSEDGPAAVEYAIMLAFILLAAMSAIVTLGQSSAGIFDATGRKMPGQ